jgi:hypothetical protein
VRPYGIQDPNCGLKQKIAGGSDEAPLSALTGFRVGPSVAQHFSSPTEKILRPFVSDGCSASPDGIPLTKENAAWRECCVAHDLEYWLGGTPAQKAAADKGLKACISEKGYPTIGRIYKAFVKKFGTSRSAQGYRWGYGWNYRRNDTPLTPEEENQVVDLYGVSRKEFVRDWISSRSVLKHVCDTYDPVFRGFSSDEVSIYRELNLSLKKDETIEWARAGYFNLIRREYAVKLEDCSEPVILVFERGSASKPKIFGNCVR